MTQDLVWLMIIANAVIAFIAIANTWLLAWYDKKPKRKPKAPAEDLHIEKRVARRIGLPSIIMIILAMLTLTHSLFYPNPNQSLQSFQIAVSVGLAVLGVVFLLVSKFIGILHRHIDLIRGIVSMVEAQSQAKSEKSPNPTVDPDARKNGARGSP